MNNVVMTFATTADADRFIAWMRTDQSEDFRGQWQIEEAR